MGVRPIRTRSQKKKLPTCGHPLVPLPAAPPSHAISRGTSTAQRPPLAPSSYPLTGQSSPPTPFSRPRPTRARRQPPVPAADPFLPARARQQPAPIAGLSRSSSSPACNDDNPQCCQSLPAAFPRLPLSSPRVGAVMVLPSACPFSALRYIVRKKGEKRMLEAYVSSVSDIS
jgi:hypothetical protein